MGSKPVGRTGGRKVNRLFLGQGYKGDGKGAEGFEFLSLLGDRLIKQGWRTWISVC